jgi:hypothetical protein
LESSVFSHQLSAIARQLRVIDHPPSAGSWRRPFPNVNSTFPEI